MLEQHGILKRTKNIADKRTASFELTEKGLGLIPVLLDMMEWGTAHDKNSAGHRKADFVERIRKDRGVFTKSVIDKIRNGKTAFT